MTLYRFWWVGGRQDMLLPQRSPSPQPHPDPTLTPPNTPKRTPRNGPEKDPKHGPETEPNGPERSQTDPKWTEIKPPRVGRTGGFGCKGKRKSLL